jgi:UDP-N-acetylglucosamine--N-acetylmuramyl-(pentapeptide) pyrophosphoryl-undecaprenol N-acetylglucosamine transferase
MEKNAALITISFDVSLNDFDIKKTYYTSNPARLDRLQCDKSKAVEMFKLDPQRRTILITGGGTGAQAINQLTLEALALMTEKNQVVHLTGKGKSIEALIPDYHDRAAQIQIRQHYRHYEFLDQGMCEILNYADIVISRAGISSLTELSLLQKPTVLIPIPNSHQEKNGKYFGKYNAVKLIDQNKITGLELGKLVVELVNNPAELSFYSKNITQMISPDAARKYVDLIYKFLQI